MEAAAIPDLIGRLRLASDADLLTAADELEALGRMVDAGRLAVAAQVAHRSRPELGSEGIAARCGQRNASALLQQELRVGPREARRRIRLGCATVVRETLTGEPLPPTRPAVAAALVGGAIGVDAAEVIVESLQAVAKRAVPEEMDLAEAALVEEAKRITPDCLLVQARVWQALLDPDGAEPREADQRERRTLVLGHIRPDGMTAFHGLASPEEAALLRGHLVAHRRGVTFAVEGAECVWHESDGDKRSKEQVDYDTFFATFTAGIRAEAEGGGGSLRTPWEAHVVASAEDLEKRRGHGWANDVLAPFSIPTVERLQCGGTSRLVVTGEQGELLHLGRRARLFTTHQRRMLATRDGGCTWPGCTAPVAWCDAHHVKWFTRDRGRTDIENGVLLCSLHHHLIHSTQEWRIRIHDHQPHLVPTGWNGPPLPRHRMQQHPLHTIAANRRM